MADPTLTINNRELEVVTQFTHLGSTVIDQLSLENEINQRIGKAVTTLGRLTARVWENALLTTKTKTAVYQACILSTGDNAETSTLVSLDLLLLQAVGCGQLHEMVGPAS